MAKGKSGNTVKTVWNIAEPVVKDKGLILWDVRFVKEGADWFLRIFIDKAGGSVDISDCENVSRALDKLLDEADPIEQSYCLEVCSPGIERELVRDSHFESSLGQKVKLRLIRAVENQRDFNGALSSYDSGKITLVLQDGSEMSFDKKDTAWIKLDDFGGF